jgi:hypothetical protein
MQPPATPFEWEHAPGLETLWLHDTRSGFCQLVPGHAFQAVEPHSDLLVIVGDLRVKMRYRLVPRPAGSPPGTELAPLLALAWARTRAESPGEPTLAPPAQLAGFGVDGAASLMYTLTPGIDREADTEEILVLVRGAQVMSIVKSFAQARTDWIGWTMLNQAATQSIVWDPARRPPVASVWPDGAFVEPGVFATARPGPRDAMRAQLSASAIAPAEQQALATALRRLFAGSEPLAQPVTDDMKRTYADYLKASCDDRALWALVDDALLQVRHAYDLHGFAIVLWRELTGGT